MNEGRVIPDKKIVEEIDRRIKIIKKMSKGYGRDTIYAGTTRLIYDAFYERKPKLAEKLLIKAEDAYLQRKLKKVI